MKEKNLRNKSVKHKENFKAKLEEKTKEAESYLDSLKRLKAEFENYRKRIEKENQEKRKYACEELILKLLNLKDNLERALKHAKDDEFSNGIKMILEQFEKILGEENISKIEALKKEFNPELHEAIAFTKGKKDMILEEIQRGYKLFDKIIRPAKVKVGQGENEND